jgi:outer membrane protein insertion porin family
MIQRTVVILVLLLSFLVMPHQAWAGDTIVTVTFDGLVNVTESTARSRITTVPGTSYSRANIKDDIKSLYKTGLFSDVGVEKNNAAGGVTLVFRVKEKVTIGKLTVTGNKKLKDEDLAEAFKIQEMELLDPAKVSETKTALIKLYEEKGYYLVDIRTSVEPFDSEKGQVELIFTIRESRSVKVKRIRFIGNHEFSDKKLKGRMKTKEKGLLSFVSGSGKLQSEKLNNDLQLLRFFYLDNGYLKVKVGEPSITLTRDKQAIYLSIPVYEGQAYKVSEVAIAGDILTTEEELLKEMSLKVGDVYKKSLEIQDTQMLKRLYGDQAYAFADVAPHIETDDSTLEAKVTYTIQKGRKIKIDKIIIKGNTVTRDKVIRRELRLLENSYYSQTGLELSRTRLYQLGFFEEVNFSTPRSTSDDKVNLVVEVLEKNTGTFSVGAGFSTLESFIFTATIQKENFFGLGWSGGVSANISKLRQDFILSMSDRYFLDSNWYLGLSLQKFKSALNSDFQQDTLGGSLALGREVFEFFSVRAGYRINDIEITDFSAQVPLFFQLNASGLTSALFSSLTYDRRDNRINTSKGYYVSGEVEYSTDKLGATNNYARFTYDNRVFFKLPKNFVLKGRGTAGYINSLDTDSVALYDRYFLGGINTLRGFDLNTVGPQILVPRTATGGDETFTYGGNKMVMFNVELQIPVYTPAGFQAVAFFDTGNAYAENENIDLMRLRMNYGFGFRWQSPFGPLRFEWGFPINRKADESSTVFNFTIGQSF